MEFNGLCEKLLKTKLVKYERVWTDFSRFYNEEELDTVLGNKADVSMMRQLYEHLQEIKVSHSDVQDIYASIQDVNNKLNHLGIV